MVEGQKLSETDNGARTTTAIKTALQGLAKKYGFSVTSDLVKSVIAHARGKGLQNTDGIKKLALDYLKQKTSLKKA